MRIDPALAALRNDSALVASQSRAFDGALGRWRAGSLARPVLDDLVRYGAGAALADCAALASACGRGAAGFARSALAPLVAALREGPLGQPRLVCSSAGAIHRLTLGASGRAALSLALVDGDALACGRGEGAPRAMFQPGETHLAVISGSANARAVRLSGGDARRRVVGAEPLALVAGDRLRLDAGREALDLIDISGALLTLRLHRRDATTAPIREYDLETGELAHQSAGDPRESRLALAAALVGRMKRRDAVPALVRIVRDEAGEGLRWQALREALGLDTAQGFALLLDVAHRDGDPLAPAAQRLADDLRARHPALAAIEEDALCLA
ncbi:MAG: hypothetical protein KGL48_06465 [Sphingomonadales bacterium]|nr:hypothetical protein [Sphingomonadales bacterium]MDE2568565.1 hypothetical protein [Sphingomonadales bacterium]